MGLGYVPEKRIRADSPVNAWPACHSNHGDFNAATVRYSRKASNLFVQHSDSGLTVGCPTPMTRASLLPLGAYITQLELPRTADGCVFVLLLPYQFEGSKQTTVFRWRWTYTNAQRVVEEPVE